MSHFDSGLSALNYREGAAPVRRRFSRHSRDNGERGVHKLRDGPSMVSNANGLRRRRGQGFMRAAEIVVRDVTGRTRKSYRESMVESVLRLPTC
jgi:hypothetical protein